MSTKEKLVKVEMPTKDKYIVRVGTGVEDAICIKNTYDSKETIIENDYITFYTDFSMIHNIVCTIENFTESYNIYLPKEDIYQAITDAQSKLIDKYEKDLSIMIHKHNSVQDKLLKVRELCKNMVNDLYGIAGHKPKSSVKNKSDNEEKKQHFIPKSKAAKTEKYGNGKYNSKGTHHKRGPVISKADGEVILEMWKTMTGKEIVEKFPMYNNVQIMNYCRRHSDFLKQAVPKDIIEKLKSYNGTKTLNELYEIYPNHNIKRLCKNHNIKYKE